MPYSLIVAVCALAFTVASFWWLHARRGTLEVAEPGAYAFGTDEHMLRLPLAIYNNGARALIVADLRVVVEGDSKRAPFGWITTRNQLKPTHDDDHRYATPFAIQGRAARELVAEFGDDKLWRPEPLRRQRLTLEARLHPSRDWTVLETFDWWPPPANAKTAQHLTYRNAANPGP